MSKKIAKAIVKLVRPENPHLEAIRSRVAKAPTEPGIYRWLDDKGTVLYVGKAKNLKNRLKQYVTGPTHTHGPWKQSFLRQVADFEVTVMNSELEALIFETNLIKELRPKYNVLMKDDKNYIYARITTHEPYPRVESVRKIDPKDKAEYFGPMLSGGELWETLNMLRIVFPFRNCKMEIVPKEDAEDTEETEDSEVNFSSVSSESSETSESSQEKKKIPLQVVCTHRDRPTPCLDYHIKKCVGPCIGTLTSEQYRHDVIDGILRFLKGDYAYVGQVLEVRMKQAALEKKYELAAMLRDQLTVLDRLQGKQVVSDTSGEDSDAVAIAMRSGNAHIVVMHKRGGRLIGDEHFALGSQTEEVGEVLSQWVAQYFSVHDVPPLVLLSHEIEGSGSMAEFLTQRRGTRVELRVPERGMKSQLIQLAEKNAMEKARQSELKWEAEKRNTEGAVAELATILQLPQPPHRIECYDISHLGGTETVGSMTVAINGKLKNDHYRSFTMRTLKSGDIDDYKSLQEVMTRRFRRLTDDLPAEEERWYREGIAFLRAKKSDAEAVCAVLKQHCRECPAEPVMKEIFVAKKGEEVIGFSLIVDRSKDVHELCVWSEQSAVRDVLARKTLRGVKKGKVYAVVPTKLEQAFGAFGFRYVVKPPATFASIPADQMVLLWESLQNKIDPSLSATPDLVVIDGGKGQLSSVQSVLDHLQLPIKAVGLAKREEEIFLPGESLPVEFPADSPAKFLLMRLRDEAHRFANAKREVKGKHEAVRSALDDIPGVGPGTRNLLMKKFGSVSAVQSADDDALLTVLSESQLKQLRNFLK